MDTWKTRFHGKWPYLTSLYSGGVNERNGGERSYRSTSSRSGRRKKYEDPVLAYETVFDPMNTYGSYNIRMSHPEDLGIGADPTIWHRQAYKQEDSSSYNTQERRGIDKETCRVVMCVLLVLSFIGVVVAATVLAVILSQSGSRPRSLQTILQGNITIVNRNFTDALYDRTSKEYKVLANEFCDALSSMYQDSNDADFKYYYQNCTVKSFAPGSIIVTFLLYVRGIPVIVDLNNFMTREIIRNNNKGFGIGSLIMMNATPLIANDGSSILTTSAVTSTPLDISSSYSSQSVAVTQDTVSAEPESTFQVPDGGSVVVPMTSQYLDQTSALSVDDVSSSSVHTSVFSTIQPSSPVVSPAVISSRMSSSDTSTTKSFHDVSIMPSSVQQSKIQSGDDFISPISTQLEPSVVPSDIMSDLSTDKAITASFESVSISRLSSEKGSSKPVTKVSITMASDQYMLASSQIEPPIVVSSQSTSDSSPVVDSITTSVDELLVTQLSAGQTTSKTTKEALLTKISDQHMVASSELDPFVVVSSQIISDSSSVVDSITTSVDELLITQLSAGQTGRTTPKTTSEALMTMASDQYTVASSELGPSVVVSSQIIFDSPPVVDSFTTSVDELSITQLSAGQTTFKTAKEALLTKISDQYMPESSEFDPPVVVSSPAFYSITKSVNEQLKTQLPVGQTSSTTASETFMTMASDQFMTSSLEFDPSVVVSSHIKSESSHVIDSVTTPVNELLLTQMSYAQTNMKTESEALMTMISDQYTIVSSEIARSVVVSSQLMSDLSPVVDSVSTSIDELLKTQMSAGQTSSKIANEASVTMTPDQYVVASSQLEPSVAVSSQFRSDAIADSFITSVNRISILPLSFGLSSSKLVNVISKTATLGRNTFASSEFDPSAVVLSDLISDSSSVAESNTVSSEGLSSSFVEQTRSLAFNEVSMAAIPHRSTVAFSEYDPSTVIPLGKRPDLSSVADSITVSFDEVSITPFSVDKTSAKAVNEVSVTPTLYRSIVASSGFDPSGVVSSTVISDLPSVADSPTTSAGVKSITNVTQVSFSSVNKISMSQTFGEFIVASSEFAPNVIVSSEHISQFSSIAESITASNIKASMSLVSIEQPISKVISEVSMTPTLHRSIVASELDPINVFSSDVISNLSSAADHVATSFDGISATPLTFEQNGSTAINEISTTSILVRPTVASSTQDLTVVVSSEDSTDSSFNTDSFASTLQETLITPLSVEQSNEVSMSDTFGKSIIVSSEFEPSNIVSLKDTSGILSSDDFIASSFDGVSMLAFSVEQTSSNSLNDIIVKQTLDQYTIVSSKLFLSSEIISDSSLITDSAVALPRVLSTTPSAVEQSSFITLNEISVTPTFGEFVAVSSESDPSVISSKNITALSSVADSSAISSGYVSGMSSSHVLVASSALTPVSVQAAPSSFQLSDVSSANILLTSPSLKHSSTLPVVASIIQPSVQVDAFSSLIHPSDVVSSVKASLDILSIDGSIITPSQHVSMTPSSVEHSNSVSVGNVSMSAFFSENINISSKLQPSIAVSMEDSITSFILATSLAVEQSISWHLEDVSISPTFTDVPTKLPLENTSALSSVYGSSMISVTTPPVVNLLTVQGNMTIDRNFTNELENSASDAYNDLAAEFCESIYSIFKGNDSIDLQNCEVIGFAPGSIIVTYILKVAGTQYVVDINNILKTGIGNNNRTGFGSRLLVLSNPSPLGISPISTTSIVQPTTTVRTPSSSFQVVVEDAVSKFPSVFRVSSSVFSAFDAPSAYGSITPTFEESASISVYEDTISTTLDDSSVISPPLKPTVAISSEDTSDLSSIVDSITTSFGTASMKSSFLLPVEDTSNDPLTFTPMSQASALPSSFLVFSMDPTMTTRSSDQLNAVAVSISPSSIQESTFSTPHSTLVNSTGDTSLYVSSVARSITTSFTSLFIEEPSSAFIEKGSISTTTLELSVDFDFSNSNYSVVASSSEISSMLSANKTIITSFEGTSTTQLHLEQSDLEQSASAEDMVISPTLVEISATSVGYPSLRNTSDLASVEDASMTLVTTPPFVNQLTVQGNITINRNFTDDLENSSSAAYIELAAGFCEAMFSIFQGNDSIEIRNCAVIGFAPGRTVVTYELDITGTQSITDIKNILDTRTANYSGTAFGNSSLVLSSPSALVNIGITRSSVTTSSFVYSTNMDPILSSSFREVTENVFSQSATAFTDPSFSFSMFNNRSADVSIMPSSVDQSNSTGNVFMIQTSSNIAVASSERKPTVLASLGEANFSSVAESIATSFKEVSIPSSSIQAFANDTSYIYSSTSLSSLYQSDASLASSTVDQSRALSGDGTSISNTEVETIIISSGTEASAAPSYTATSQLITDKSISTSFEDIPTLQATMNQSSAIFEDVSPSQIVDEMTLFSSLVQPSVVISSEIISKDTSGIDEFIMISSEHISVSTSIVDETIVPSSAEQSMYSVQSMSTPVG